MDKKENFKLFVKENPSLLKHVKEGSMDWQKFYEMYDLYGDNNDVWKEYLTPVKVAAAAGAGFGISEFIKYLRTLDMDSIQNGVNNFQRVVGVLGDLTNKNSSTEKPTYKPRPLYKHFDD